MEKLQSQRQMPQTPPEMATLIDELETGRLAVCWAESTC